MNLGTLSPALFVACLSSAASLRLMPSQAGSQASGGPHPWPHALGPDQRGTSDAALPFPLERTLSWSWHHPLGRYASTIAGGPIIDAEKNLYLMNNDGIRKFTPDGTTLWWYRPPGDTNNEPSLMGDSVFGTTKNGFAFAIDQHTGKELWATKLAEDSGGDVGYPGAHDGMYVAGMEEGKVKGHEGGNEKIIGINATSGRKVWEYKAEWPSWNFMPIFDGDSRTFVFMDFTGGIYRLGLHNGSEIWHKSSPGTSKSRPSFGDGGVTVGSNGMAYTCSQPESNGGVEGTEGVLRAYRVSSGERVWARTLPQPCNSWPAVGRLGAGPELSVVVTPGSFMMTADVMHGGVMAFDAESGRLQWKWQAPPYSHVGRMAMGDLEGIKERQKYDPNHQICLPAHWSAPQILGDGTVLAGRADGVLYKLKGPAVQLPDEDTSRMNSTFTTSPGVVLQDKFDAHGAPLHGAMAMAPGMFAFSTCTDNMFVFRY